MLVRILGKCKSGGVRRNNATGKLRMACMHELPVVQSRTHCSDEAFARRLRDSAEVLKCRLLTRVSEEDIQIITNEIDLLKKMPASKALAFAKKPSEATYRRLQVRPCRRRT